MKEKDPHFHKWLSFSCFKQPNECLCKLVIQPKGSFLDVVITEHCCGRVGAQSLTVSWEEEGPSKKAVWKWACVCVCAGVVWEESRGNKSLIKAFVQQNCGF